MAADDQAAEKIAAVPRWDPEQQVYVDGIVPENAEVKTLIEKNGGSLRLFGYGSLCWNPGTGALAKDGIKRTLGRARGYKRCWAQKSTDHRGRPAFPGIVCTLLEDSEVADLQSRAAKTSGAAAFPSSSGPTMTEGVIYLIPPELVDECLDDLDFREKGGYARDVINVVEDETGETHQALLYRGTPDNPAFWSRALLDLPLAAAVMSVSEGPSGKNDFYLNSLDQFLSETHTIAAENDDTMQLAEMVRYFQEKAQLHFIYGFGSNQHNQLLLKSPRNGGFLNCEDAYESKEIVLCTPRGSSIDEPKQIFSGGGHSGLLTTSGKLYLWGWNENGQCGTSTTTQQTSLAMSEPIADVTVADAALGFSHTIVIEEATQRVLLFGSNERGQLNGKPSKKYVTTPTSVSFLVDEKIVAAAAGLFHSAVITEDGELITFGCSLFGQSLSKERSTDNDNDNDNDACERRWKPDDGSHLVGVSCGRRHTAVLDDRGRIWTFGENTYGQLGRTIDGKKDPSPDLVSGIVGFPEGSEVTLDCGWSHTLVHIETPEGHSMAYGWGRNDKGQLGAGTTDHIMLPQRVFIEQRIGMIACGSESTMVLDKKGKIWGCGWNEHGNLALGIGTMEDQLTLSQTTGAAVVGPPGLYNGKVVIAAGGAHVLTSKVAR